MAHAHNLSKGVLEHLREDQARCVLCGLPETQQHVNVACTHSLLVEIRQAHQRHVDNFFQCYRHQHLPRRHRWVVPILEYMKEHLWSNTAVGSNIWNERWTPNTFEGLQLEYKDIVVPHQDHKAALTWMQRLTKILQQAQRTI